MTLFSWKTLTGRFSFLELFDSGGQVVELFPRVPHRQHPARAGRCPWGDLHGNPLRDQIIWV